MKNEGRNERRKPKNIRDLPLLLLPFLGYKNKKTIKLQKQETMDWNFANNSIGQYYSEIGYYHFSKPNSWTYKYLLTYVSDSRKISIYNVQKSWNYYHDNLEFTIHYFIRYSTNMRILFTKLKMKEVTFL